MSACCTPLYDLCIAQNATYERVFVWMVPNGTAIGAAPIPVDLTGYTATLQIRAYALAPTILYDASNDIVLGGTTGTITLTIPDTATATFTWWAGVYDLLLTSSQGVATRFLTGNVTVSPGVSA